MTLYLLHQWKLQPGGPQNPMPFMLALSDASTPYHEKELIVRTLDDWGVLTSTWFEIADFLPTIERLAEDPQFPERHRAALLASKVAYSLTDYAGALQLAISAGELFSLHPREAHPEFGPQDELFVHKIIEQAVDTYKNAKRDGAMIDVKLEGLLNRIFDLSMDAREFRHVVGLALDTRRLDQIERAVKAAEDASALLSETVAKVFQSQLDRAFRSRVLDVLLRLFSELAEPDFVSMCQCLIKLEKPADVAEILNRLIQTPDGELLAYQISFDLYENATQQFIQQIEKALIVEDNTASTTTAADTSMDTSMSASGTTATTTTTGSVSEVTATAPTEASATGEGASHAGSLEDTSSDEKPGTGIPTPIRDALRRILSGEETIKHHMQFLIKNNHTDMLILRQIKDVVRAACTHNATVVANGLMHVGTTCDDFLRDNLEWTSKATNWNKFNAVATLGLIHRGHESDALKLLEPYLPKGDGDQFGYKEGGALFAYGLIHTNHGSPDVVSYLRGQLGNATTVAVRHGACLGLGVAALASQNAELYSQLKDVLYMDDAVVGEAAGTAMGLVMASSLDRNIFNEMVQYIGETAHDKIQRGLRTGLSLLAYGRMEEVEPFVTDLLNAKSNPVLRQTAVCMLAMAYAGSGKADVVRRLLAKVASDPNQDVKRFAVIAVGFVLSNDPEQCLSYTGMLVEHFNGHVRYGAAIALGIACAGSGYKEAIALLEPMLSAKENFVRQGALIALSFILIQQTEPTCPKVVDFRKTIMRMITEKTEEQITKFGAVLAQGILDAGGRNVTISLHNRNGHPDMTSVIGTFVFLQHWYWHSFSLFASLAFKPTCLIGLNKNLEMPAIEFKCNAKPSTFAYPPPLEDKKKEETEKVEAAVLSITFKKKQKEKEAKSKSASAAATTPASSTTTTTATGTGTAAVPTIAVAKPFKEDESTAEKMEVDTTSTSAEDTKAPAKAADDKTSSGKDASKEAIKEPPVPEPNNFNVKNPARVVRLQLKTLQVLDDSRYKPLKSLGHGGIILLRDTKPDEKEDIVALVPAGGSTSTGGPVNAELPQPPPFEINLENY